MIAHDKVVCACYLGELAVADVEHLANYGEFTLASLRYLAQVQERDKGLRVGRVGIRPVRVAEDDHMVVGGNRELIEGAAVRGVALAGRDLLVSESVEAGRGDGAVGSHNSHFRVGMDVVVEFGDYRRCAIVPTEDQGALGLRLSGYRFPDRSGLLDLRGRTFREIYRAVVFGDEYDLIVCEDLGVSLGIQPDTAILFTEPDHRTALVDCEGFAEGHASETGLAGEVDLIPPEV